MYSVIIPAKNEKDNIVRCIQSIYASTDKADSVEIIVVDNGSTDNTAELAEKAGAKVFIKEELNIAGLRNYGAQQATNEIIAFIDADCEAGKTWLERGYDILKENDGIGVVGGQYVCPKNSTWVQKAWDSVRLTGINKVNFVTSGNLFTKKHIFLEFNGFDTALETGEDYDLCIRISKKHRIISDDRLNIIHFGEPATLMQRLKKEIWYGKSVKQILKNKLLYLPFWLSLIFMFFLILLILGIILSSIFLISFAGLSIFSLLSSISFYRCKKASNFHFFFPLIFIYFFYLMGRVISLFFFFKEKRFS